MGLTRRDLLRSAAAASVGALAGAGGYGAVVERHRVVLLAQDLPVAGLPAALDGLRVGMITDIHHSAVVPASDVAQAVTLLAQARPDLVVLGGDYVTNRDRAYIAPAAELLAPLAGAPEGSFAVLGNHDDDREVPAALAARGFQVLKDQRTALAIRGVRLDLAGVRFWTKSAGDIARVLRGTGATTILLAHDPRRLVEAASLGVQLVLSGHTHGGQVILPGVGALVKRAFPVLAGLATLEQTSLFVSRGVGTVYVPVRINCPADVAVLTLRSMEGLGA